MELIIAEKPSVGRTVAAVLGIKEIRNGYIEGNGYYVSWGFGHLIELASAEIYDPSYKDWDINNLPIIPEKPIYTIKKESKEQFAVLKKLMHNADVDTIIAATDADREGELIFRLIYNMAGCTKPVLRLWLSSMEEKSIKEAMKQLKNGNDYDSLFEAAKCRQVADWLYGINFTRLMTKTYGTILPIGRVMTPTLRLVVDRDLSIDNFKKESFWSVCLNVGFILKGNRIFDEYKARQIANDAFGKNVSIIEFQKKTKKTNPPLLFDLTTMQRVANKIYGYSSDKVLEIAQSLYEKGLMTYPRTESKYIASSALEDFKHNLSTAISILELDSHDIDNPLNVVNDNKVVSHPALLITTKLTKDKLQSLSKEEKDISILVAKRMIEAVSFPEEYDEVEIKAQCVNEDYHFKGKRIIYPGWKSIDKNSSTIEIGLDREEDCAIDNLPDVAIGTILNQKDPPTITNGETTPPKRMTDDSLLSSMEHASSEEFKEIENAEHDGLGTPATRATIIKKLIDRELLARKGKNIISTTKGKALIEIVPESLKDSTTTAEWERVLKDIEHGKQNSAFFMDGIKKNVTNIVNNTKNIVPSEEKKSQFDMRTVIGKCPRCGSNIVSTRLGYSCINKKCGFVLWKENKYFNAFGKSITQKIAKELITNGKTYIPDLVSKKTGKTFGAMIIMEKGEGNNSNFRLSFDDLDIPKHSPRESAIKKKTKQ